MKGHNLATAAWKKHLNKQAGKRRAADKAARKTRKTQYKARG